MTKFRTTFTLLDIKLPTRLHGVQIDENISAVSVSVNVDHQLSIRRLSQQLSLCYSITWKILLNDFKPFKLHLIQELKSNDLPQHRIFNP